MKCITNNKHVGLYKTEVSFDLLYWNGKRKWKELTPFPARRAKLETPAAGWREKDVDEGGGGRGTSLDGSAVKYIYVHSLLGLPLVDIDKLKASGKKKNTRKWGGRNSRWFSLHWGLEGTGAKKLQRNNKNKKMRNTKRRTMFKWKYATQLYPVKISIKCGICKRLIIRWKERSNER